MPCGIEKVSWCGGPPSAATTYRSGAVVGVPNTKLILLPSGDHSALRTTPAAGANTTRDAPPVAAAARRRSNVPLWFDAYSMEWPSGDHRAPVWSAGSAATGVGSPPPIGDFQ